LPNYVLTKNQEIKMKIAFTTSGTDWNSTIDPRFGRTEYFFVYNESTEEASHFDNRAVASAAHGAGPQAAKALFDLNADVLITGNGPGGNAAVVLQKADLKIYIGAGDMTVKEAYDAYRSGNLTEF
jgi:predicted Fe-Mo cluster-binding NifX family protein